MAPTLPEPTLNHPLGPSKKQAKIQTNIYDHHLMNSRQSRTQGHHKHKLARIYSPLNSPLVIGRLQGQTLEFV